LTCNRGDQPVLEVTDRSLFKPFDSGRGAPIRVRRRIRRSSRSAVPHPWERQARPDSPSWPSH